MVSKTVTRSINTPGTGRILEKVIDAHLRLCLELSYNVCALETLWLTFRTVPLKSELLVACKALAGGWAVDGLLSEWNIQSKFAKFNIKLLCSTLVKMCLT